MCPRCLLCCGFLRFPAVASCGLVTLAARHLLCAACGRAVCYVARVSTVYGSRGYAGSGRFVPRCHRRYNFVRCSVDFYFDIGSSLTSARGRGRCGRAAPATNEACNHETCADLSADLAGGLQRACWCCSCAAVHSSAVSVGLCRDAPRGRPMCYEDEGALTSIEEVNVRACPKKGFSPNMFAKHRRFFHGLSASGGPLPNPVPV